MELSVNKKSTQRIIIETHSEHLIRKLQVLVAREDHFLTADMIAEYSVEKSENAETQDRKMD